MNALPKDRMEELNEYRMSSDKDEVQIFVDEICPGAKVITLADVMQASSSITGMSLGLYILNSYCRAASKKNCQKSLAYYAGSAIVVIPLIYLLTLMYIGDWSDELQLCRIPAKKGDDGDDDGSDLMMRPMTISGEIGVMPTGCVVGGFEPAEKSVARYAAERMGIMVGIGVAMSAVGYAMCCTEKGKKVPGVAKVLGVGAVVGALSYAHWVHIYKDRITHGCPKK